VVLAQPPKKADQFPVSQRKPTGDWY
jgi:hypothetical protein